MVEEIKNTQEIQGKSKISDWDKMKKKMKDYFLPLSSLKPYTNDTIHWGKGWGLWISTPMNSISTNTIKVNYIKKQRTKEDRISQKKVLKQES